MIIEINLVPPTVHKINFHEYWSWKNYFFVSFWARKGAALGHLTMRDEWCRFIIYGSNVMIDTWNESLWPQGYISRIFFFAIILLGLKIVYYKFPYVWKLYELYQSTLYRNELSWPCSFIWHINHDYRPINNETTSENPSLPNRKEHRLFASNY